MQYQGRLQRESGYGITPRENYHVNEEWISDKSRFVWDGIRVQRLDTPLKKIEAIDVGRRSIHDEGAGMLLEAFKEKTGKSPYSHLKELLICL